MIIGIRTNIYGKFESKRYLFPNDPNPVETKYGNGYRLRDYGNMTRIVIFGSAEAADSFMDWYYGN